MWSAKGGVGLSVCAAGAAIAQAEIHGESLLVDLIGDQAAILGIAEPDKPGVQDWLASGVNGGGSIMRLTIDVGAGVHLLTPGNATTWDSGRNAELADALDSQDLPVVIDAGVRSNTFSSSGVESSARLSAFNLLVEELCSVGAPVLVTTPCYLALRRAVKILHADSANRSATAVSIGSDQSDTSAAPTTRARPIDRLVLVSEGGRALDAADVGAITQLELMAQIERDPAVARRVDAGLFLTRTDRCLIKKFADL